jgi:hypothetical protein
MTNVVEECMLKDIYDMDNHTLDTRDHAFDEAMDFNLGYDEADGSWLEDGGMLFPQK